MQSPVIPTLGALAAAIALCGAAMASPSSPPAPASPAPASPAQASPAQASLAPPTAAHAEAAKADMISLYQDYCLDRFPNAQHLLAYIGGRNFPPAPPGVAMRALNGHAGQAWIVTRPSGQFVLALGDAPRSCVVTGVALNDAGTRAVFDIMVTMYAGAHEYGALSKPPLQTAQLGGKPAFLQVIGALPGGEPRQAFVNMAITNPDGTAMTRLAREVAPPQPPLPPVPPAAANQHGSNQPGSNQPGSNQLGPNQLGPNQLGPKDPGH
jgi:hypothetical protein